MCFYLRSSNKELAETLDQAVDPQDPLVNRLLRMMATSAMSQALYFSTGAQAQDQYYHYGCPPVLLPPLHHVAVSSIFNWTQTSSPRPGSGQVHTLHLAHPSLRRHGGAPPPDCSPGPGGGEGPWRSVGQ